MRLGETEVVTLIESQVIPMAFFHSRGTTRLLVADNDKPSAESGNAVGRDQPTVTVCTIFAGEVNFPQFSASARFPEVSLSFSIIKLLPRRNGNRTATRNGVKCRAMSEAVI